MESKNDDGGGQVLLITTDALGSGNEELGRVLMVNCLRTLAAAERLPAVVLLMNAGVKLALEGSPVLDALRGMEERGAEIRACTTCLKFFNVLEKLAVGTASGMGEAVETLTRAARTMTL
ncbi:MAG: sulfurtransferase-like selenium metabolism protein YedF [Acidobacteria bacterium]|nr:sulfurtransferase-like selenium metabolism protein YedF [Acidobacteriota bacterium]